MRWFFRKLQYTALILLLLVVGLSLMPPAVASPSFRDLDQRRRNELADFLSLRLEADASEERRAELDERIAALEAEIRHLEDYLAEAEDRYAEARGRTVTALRWLHRMGPTSYLDVLLSANSLRDLLRRTEIVRAAARGSLLALVDVRREKLARAEVQDDIAEREEELAALRDEREELLVIFHRLEEAEERLMAEFGDDWPRVSAEIVRLIALLEEEVLPYLEALSGHFAALAEQGITPDGVLIRPSLFQVRAVVPAAGLNGVLDERPDLRGAQFELEPDEVRLVCPELHLSVTGRLFIGSGGVIVYDPDAVYLAGLPLREERVLDSVGQIELDLSAATGDLRPRELTVREDEVELVLTLFP